MCADRDKYILERRIRRIEINGMGMEEVTGAR